MNIKLKPCPFCGEEKARIVYQDQESGELYCIDSEEELEDKDLYAYIHCYGCDIDVLPNAADKPKDMIRAWNIRGGVENEPLA